MSQDEEQEKTSLFGELKRRNVFKVAGVYIITCWLSLQIADILLPALLLPDWSLTLIVILMMMGFPFALILAWAFELTADGVKRAEDVEPHESVAHETGRKLNYGVIAALSLAIVLLLIRQEFHFGDEGTKTGDDENQVLVDDGGDAGHSIAVLPFRNMSEDPANEYFSEGVSEEILNALVKVPKLRVVSRTSSFAYKGEKSDLRDIGRKLGASHVLEGSVRRSGDEVRVTAQLIDSSDGFHIWSETYHAELDDIFSVQENISQAIVDALRLQLMPEELARLGRLATHNIQAYDLYLRAQSALRKATMASDYDNAIGLFDEAIRMDPTFAEAEAGKCSAFYGKYQETRDTNFVDSAIDTCGRASVMDPGSPAVFVALGNLYIGTGRPEFAIQAMDQALAAGHDRADIQSVIGDAHKAAGRLEQAKTHYENAIAIEPKLASNHVRLAALHVRGGDFESAVASFLRAISMEPDNHRHYSNLGGVYFYLGRFDAAAQAFTQSIKYQPNSRAYSNAATNHYYAGQFEQSLGMFESAVELMPEDHRIRGNLADACRWVSACSSVAAVHYQQAVELAERQLRINPNDAVAAAQRGRYLVHLGQTDEGLSWLARALETNENDVDVLLVAALIYTRLQQVELAHEYLERLRAAGFPEAALLADPDLNI